MSNMFSIIVPVYNIQKYIEQCINSILKQKCSDYEIIIVDDGSIDKSLEICNNLAKLSKRIKVIHQENKGLSEARNTGIKSATGEYLMFIDGDDYMDNCNCLNDIKNIVEKEKPDIIQYKMRYFYEKKNKYVSLKDLPNMCEANSKEQVLQLLIETGTLSVSACDKVVKKSIIDSYNLLFKPRYII